MNRENRRPITLEDIIRLKRAERPPAQFWDQFDRELRAKQLSALMEKRPWWRNLSWTPPRLARYTLSLGAAAVLAVAFVATRSSLSVVSESATPSTRVFAQEQTTESAQAEIVSVVQDQSAVSSNEVVAQEAVIASSELASALSEAPIANPVFVGFRGVARPTVPLQNATLTVDEALTNHTFARDLAAVRPSNSMAAGGLFITDQEFKTRGASARPQPIDPLSQMAGPAAANKAKYSSALATSFSRQQSTGTSERMARRLSSEGEERLYETKVSRIKVRGDAFDWKL